MKSRIFLALLVVLSAGCMDQQNADSSHVNHDAEVAKLRMDVDVLNKQVENLRLQNAFEKWGKYASLSVGDTGYSIFQTDIGAITAQIDDVKPFASGSKVTIVFGNPHAATITGINFTANWGQVDDGGSRVESTAKQQPFNLAVQNLGAGTWTKVSIVLEGITPEKLGYLEIRDFGFTGLRLAK